MTPDLLIGSITLFVLSIFLGVELITKVPAMLHTPLMSGANAISGISVVGALIGANVAYDGGDTVTSGILAFIALVLAMINVVGGFAVNKSYAEYDCWKEERCLKWKTGYQLIFDLSNFLHLRIEETRHPRTKFPEVINSECWVWLLRLLQQS